MSPTVNHRRWGRWTVGGMLLPAAFAIRGCEGRYGGEETLLQAELLLARVTVMVIENAGWYGGG